MEQSITTTIVSFINNIGIPCQEAPVGTDTFLPGIQIKDGTILYDPQQLKYPGDLLHEAGHLAILSTQDRQQAGESDKMFGDLSKDGAELAAIAWSWAALQHIKLGADILFHGDGYKGGASALVDNFSNGNYIGVPMLRWLNMTNGDISCRYDGPAPYPQMTHWLRQ